MTTAEGIFPKAAGDPLYASEANWFGRGVFQWMYPAGSVTSGIAFADVGSIVIPAGSLTNPCSFRAFTAGNSENMGTLCQLGINFSGTSIGINQNINGNAANGAAQDAHIFVGVLGSFSITGGYGSGGFGYCHLLDKNLNTVKFVMNPNLGFVLKYQLRHDNTSSVGQSLALSSFEAINLGSA